MGKTLAFKNSPEIGLDVEAMIFINLLLTTLPSMTLTIIIQIILIITSLTFAQSTLKI